MHCAFHAGPCDTPALTCMYASIKTWRMSGIAVLMGGGGGHFGMCDDVAMCQHYSECHGAANGIAL